MHQFKVISVGSLAGRLGWYKNKQGQRPKAMMFVLCLLVEALSVLSVTVAGELLDNGNNTKYLTGDGEYFEGDIILLPEQLNYVRQSQNADDSVKSLISDPTALWPGKTVYYDFAPREFSFAQRQTIISALNDIMFASCVRFIRRTTQPTYIVLRNNGIGCAAAVGYHGSGPLDLFLGGPSCQTRGTIQHELMHTLGFWHEHTRLDRDSHVTILWQNISPGAHDDAPDVSSIAPELNDVFGAQLIAQRYIPTRSLSTVEQPIFYNPDAALKEVGELRAKLHIHIESSHHDYIIISAVGKEFNFYKRDPTEIMSLNLPYDYGSVMHYRSVAFSRDFRSPTIIPRVPSAARLMGQRIRFSQVDIAKLNRLYKCSRRYYHGDDVIGKSGIIGHVEEEDSDFNIKEVEENEVNSTDQNDQNSSLVFNKTKLLI